MPWGVLAARHKSVAFSKVAKRAAVERKKAALTEHERYRAEREYASCPAPFGREQALARLAALGERVTQGELETLLRDAGHDEEVGTVVTMERWLKVLAALKLRFLETTAQPDGDQVEAFASLGGCRDKTGHIAAAKLKAVFEDFSLGIDIERLMDEMDEEKDGLVSYHEFAQLLRAATSAPRHSALGASGHPPHHWRVRGAAGRLPLTPEASSLLHPGAAAGGDEETADCGASVSLRFPPGSGAIDDAAAAAAVGVGGGGLAGSDDDATDESVNSEEAAAAEAAAAEAAAAAAAAAAEEEQVEVVATSASLLQSLEEIPQKQEKGQRQALRAVTKWVQTLTHEISSDSCNPSSTCGSGGGGSGGRGSANRTAARQYANHYAVPITRERAAAAPCIQQLPRRRCQEAATVRQRTRNDSEPTPAVFCRLTERASVRCLRRTMRERVREKKAAGGTATSVCVTLDRNCYTRDTVSEAWAAEPTPTRQRAPQPRAAEAPVLVSSFSAARSGRATPRPATALPARSATFACGLPLGLTTSAVSYATTAGASAASSRGGGGGNPLFLSTETHGGGGGATLGRRRSGGAHGRARRRLAEEVRRAQDFTRRVRRDVSGGNGPPCFYKAGVVGSPRLADYDAAIAQMYDTQVKGVAVAASARVAAAAAALCVAFEAERSRQERLAHVAEVANVFSAACG